MSINRHDGRFESKIARLNWVKVLLRAPLGTVINTKGLLKTETQKRNTDRDQLIILYIQLETAVSKSQYFGTCDTIR